MTVIARSRVGRNALGRLERRRIPASLHTMRQAQDTLSLRTGGQGLYEITGDVARWLSGQKASPPAC